MLWLVQVFNKQDNISIENIVSAQIWVTKSLFDGFGSIRC